MTPKKLLIISLITFLMGLFFYFDLGQHLNLVTIKQQQDALALQYQQAPVLSIALACVVFVLYAALPVPGLIFLTLLFSALFGFWGGFLITSFGAALGGTLAFLAARYLLRAPLQRSFPKQYQTVNNGIDDNGSFYLFSIRMVPVLPFFMVNALMGLTTLKVREFYIATQLGMLASTAVFANAGTQLSQVTSIAGLFSPALIASFILMAVLPLITKLLIQQFQKQRMVNPSSNITE